MPTMPAQIPVIIIQTPQSDLYAMETIPGLSIRIINELNPNTLQSIIRDPMTKHTIIILEKEAFEGYESPMRGFIKKIREKHRRDPRILVLRCKSMGMENPILTEGDKTAGANAVLWYLYSMSAKDITKCIHQFIRGLPMTDPVSQEIHTPVRAVSKRAKAPAKQRRNPASPQPIPSASWLEHPLATKHHAPAVDDTPAKTIADIATFKPIKRRAKVTLFGITLSLRLSIATALLALPIAPARISQEALRVRLGINLRQSAYEAIKKLKNDLDEYREGLSDCLITTKIISPSSRYFIPHYSFDAKKFCTVLGIR